MTRFMLSAQTELIILSPHLDDAVFSLGSFMTKYARTNKVSVINIFTNATSDPPTLSARAFLSQIGVTDPLKLFQLRRNEDRIALATIGIKAVNLGEIDALWRRYKRNNIIPELDTIYPTYRFHVSQGRVSIRDTELIGSLKTKILKHLPSHDNYRLFVPIGHGGHVDHVLTRQVAEAIVPEVNIIYYLDFPYSVRAGAKSAVPPLRHIPLCMPTNSRAKHLLCSHYVSQYSKVIPDSSLLKTPETIYIYRSPLPKTINGYSIEREIFPDLEDPGAYRFGIYRKGKRKLFVKFYFGSKNSLAFKWLKNEHNAYTYLNKTVKTHDYNITIPKMVTGELVKKPYYLALNYVEGSTLSSIPRKVAVNIIMDSMAFMHSLPISNVELVRRNAIYWHLLLLPILIVTLFRRDVSLSHWLKLIKIISLNARSIWTKHRNVFVHRDLSLDNIITTNWPIKKNVIIDFQLSTVADPILDLSIFVLKHYSQKDIISTLKKHWYYSTLLDGKNTNNRYINYLVILGLYDLLLPDGDHEVAKKLIFDIAQEKFRG